MAYRPLVSQNLSAILIVCLFCAATVGARLHLLEAEGSVHSHLSRPRPLHPLFALRIPIWTFPNLKVMASTLNTKLGYRPYIHLRRLGTESQIASSPLRWVAMTYQDMYANALLQTMSSS